jgi:TonB family protein
MDALFSAADAPSAPPLLAGFLRRRHLARRLVALAEEVVMSRVRVAIGGVLVTGVLAGSGSVALAAWPLAANQSASPGLAAGSPAGGGQLSVVHRQAIDVPSGLSTELTHATLVLDLVVDGAGAVTAARPVSLAIRNQHNNAQLNASERRSLEALLNVAGAPGGRRPFDGAAVVRDLDAMLQAASAALTQWRFEAPAAAPAIARVPAEFDLVANKATTGPVIPLSGFAGAAGLPTTTFVARPDTRAADGTLRAGGAIKPPQKVYGVNPVYPQEAKDAGVEGIVVIDTKIGAVGSVAEAWVVKSTAPILDAAALDAVRQWRYTPTMMNGVAVPIIVTVTVSFTLR